MADGTNALLAMLGQNDLNTFAQNATAGNIYSTLAPSILNAQFDTRSWDPGTSAAVSFGKALLGGLANNYGRQQVADQVNAVSALLPQLYSDPANVVFPENVDAGAGAALRQDAIAKNLLRGEANRINKESTADDLIKSIFSKQNSRIPAGLLSKIAEEGTLLDGVDLAEMEPRRPNIDASGLLSSGVEGSILGDVDRAAQAMIANGAPAGQAYETAGQAYKTKRDELDRSYKSIEDAEKTSSELKNLTSSLRLALQGAGDTGQSGQLKQTLSGLASYFSEDQAKKYAAGQDVESLSNQVIGITGKAFKGPMSDRDVALMLKQAPSLSTEEATNQSILDRWEYAANLQSTYVDYMRAAQAKGVPVAQAEAQWKVIKQSNPYTVMNKDTGKYDVNPVWKEGLSSLNFGGNAGSPSTAVPSASTGGKLKASDLIAQGYVRTPQGWVKQ